MRVRLDDNVRICNFTPLSRVFLFLETTLSKLATKEAILCQPGSDVQIMERSAKKRAKEKSVRRGSLALAPYRHPSGLFSCSLLFAPSPPSERLEQVNLQGSLLSVFDPFKKAILQTQSMICWTHVRKGCSDPRDPSPAGIRRCYSRKKGEGKLKENLFTHE